VRKSRLRDEKRGVNDDIFVSDAKGGEGKHLFRGARGNCSDEDFDIENESRRGKALSRPAGGKGEEKLLRKE